MIEVGGIDPGLTGAIAKYNGERLVCYALKPHKAETGRGRELDWVEVEAIYEIMFGDCTHMFIEKVQAINKKGEKKQGASSVFKFGYVAGVLYGIVVSHGLKPEMVYPQTWKGAFGLIGVGVTTKAKKAKAIERACEIFPDNKSDFFGPRGGGLDGVAEAALIAWYGYQQVKDSQ